MHQRTLSDSKIILKNLRLGKTTLEGVYNEK